MPRAKVKIAYMTNDAARRSTCKKRTKSLLKKMKELSTLCGIEVYGVIYSPGEAEPTVYPSPDKVHRMIGRLATMDKPGRGKKMLDMEGYLRERIQKVKESLERLRRENWEKEMVRVMFEAMHSPGTIQDMGTVELNNLREIVGRYLLAVQVQMIKLNKAKATVQADQP